MLLIRSQSTESLAAKVQTSGSVFHAGLLQLLELPGQTERLLGGASIAIATLPNVVQAAWQLHDSVEALKVHQIDDILRS